MNNKFNILKEEYNFLRENSDLKNIPYLVLSGSYGYGTNNENSDIDLRGFLIEDKKYIFGINNFEQFEDTNTDTVIYGFKKFINLCVNANPNVIELLGVDDDSIIIMNESGKKIRENSKLFLSKKVIQSFGNYAIAQFRRLSNALCHDSYNFIEQENHLKNTLNSQIDHFNRTYTAFQSGSFNIYLDENQNLLFDVNLKKYPLRDFLSIYSEMNNTVKTYNKLNHRNRKKDDNHLNKHAMHLIRLLLTGIDILKGSGIITKRKDENKLLMDIRNGKFSFTEIFKMFNEYQTKFNEVSKVTNLPDNVDLLKIQNLMIEIYLDNI